MNLLLSPGTKRRWSRSSEGMALEMLEAAGFDDRHCAIVYGLFDPDTDEIRYVGCCANGLGYRLTRHLYFAQTGKHWRISQWIRDLDFRIGVRVLAVDPPNPKVLELEWIHRLREQGTDLTNYVGGPTTETQKRAATAANNRRWADPDRRRRLAESNRRGETGFKGRRHSVETRGKISAAQKGIPKGPASDETRERMSEAAKERCSRVKEVMP